jgi:hypothetical protein
MKNIEKKALYESKKKMVKNLANEDDIIEISIVNNIVHLTKPTKTEIYVCRQNEVVTFLNDCCKILDKNINLVINIGLHDTYKDNLGIMVFSITNSNQQNILIPDYYSMSNYDGKLDINVDIPFDQKLNKAIFVGSSTGSVNPRINERLNLCNTFINNNNIKCYISNFCQININDIIKEYPNYRLFSSSHIPILNQLEYKYIINVDGNTCTWDRIPWILNNNSICLKKKSNHKCWYYDFMNKGEHFIEFDNDNEIQEKINKISFNDCKRIINNANQFCNNYLKRNCHLQYMAKLLYYISKNY